MKPRTRSVLFRTGLCMFVIGALPLCVYSVVEWTTGDPANPGTAIWPGLWLWGVGGTGLLLCLVAISNR